MLRIYAAPTGFGPDTGRGVFLTIMTWRLLQAWEAVSRPEVGASCEFPHVSGEVKPLALALYMLDRAVPAFSVVSEIWLNVCCLEPTATSRMRIFGMSGMKLPHECGLESPRESPSTTDCPADTRSSEGSSPAYSNDDGCSGNHFSRSGIQLPLKHTQPALPPGYPTPPGLGLVADAAPAFQQGSGIGGQPNRAWMVSGVAFAPPCTDVPKDVLAGVANMGLAAEVHGSGAVPGQPLPVPAACGTSHCDVSLQKRINKDRASGI